VEGRFLLLFVDDIMLSALVAFTVISEFVRGGRVIGRHTSQNLFASMVQLAHRNTRRYGGYIVHFGVIVIMIASPGPSLIRIKSRRWASATK